MAGRLSILMTKVMREEEGLDGRISRSRGQIMIVRLWRILLLLVTVLRFLPVMQPRWSRE